MYIFIVRWVGAGLGNYGFSAIIVGKTRPYNWDKFWLGGAGLGDYGFSAIIVGKTRPYNWDKFCSIKF
ncbi:hypothetical protein [Microcoleus sp. B7-D4]|uniref:hypothetical protein n=1 Tax=Microcoleus sp. B7-D4 TaxID=2818696 RepID=UPI002FD4F8D2